MIFLKFYRGTIVLDWYIIIIIITYANIANYW